MMWEKYLHWLATGLLCSLYAVSAALYIARRRWALASIQALGYPIYLVRWLTVAKILAAITLLLPVNPLLTGLAYAGMFFHLLISAIAHFEVKQPRAAIPAAIALFLLLISFTSHHESSL